MGESITLWNAKRLRENLEFQLVQRQINPPIVIRESCRFCGKPLKVTDELKPRRHGQFTELYAHWACYTREVRG